MVGDQSHKTTQFQNPRCIRPCTSATNQSRTKITHLCKVVLKLDPHRRHFAEKNGLAGGQEVAGVVVGLKPQQVSVQHAHLSSK